MALLIGHATGVQAVQSLVGLVNTVIGLGGRGDPLSARVPDKLDGFLVPDGYTYVAVEYPADLDMINSVRVGMPVLEEHLGEADGDIRIAAYSEGTLLAERLKRNLARSDSPDAPSPLDLSFLEIAAPFVPNGGIFARFPGIGIPLLIPGMGAAQPSIYDTTYYFNEYDTYGDFPAYFNPLALLNTLLAVAYTHPDAYYDPVDPEDSGHYVKVVENSAGGTDTYVMIPNEHLPLLAPVRAVADALGLTPVSERLLGAVEPLLRVMIDMAYTDRENLNPESRTPFSLITPPHKIVEALAAVPGAIKEGLDNFLGVKPRKAGPPESEPTQGEHESDTDPMDPAAQDSESTPPLHDAPESAADIEVEDVTVEDIEETDVEVEDIEVEDIEEADVQETDVDETQAEEPAEIDISEATTEAEPDTTVQKRNLSRGPIVKAVRDTIRTVFGSQRPGTKKAEVETTEPQRTQSKTTGPKRDTPASAGAAKAGSDQDRGDTGAAAA